MLLYHDVYYFIITTHRILSALALPALRLPLNPLKIRCIDVAPC